MPVKTCGMQQEPLDKKKITLTIKEFIKEVC